MGFIFSINSGPLKRFEPTPRDKRYLRFIKLFPCVCCGKEGSIDPCHFGDHGISIKASDYDALPMCRQCHNEQGKSAKRFAERKGLNLPELREYFLHIYKQKYRIVELPVRRKEAA